MASTNLKQKRFYGWIALAGAASVFFCFCGTWYVYGVFLPPLIEEFGWSRAALSGPYSLYRIMWGLSGPLVGISIIKFGIRKNIIIGNLITSLGLICMALTKELWHIYLFYGILVGIGCGFGSSIPAMSVANNWFVKRRALAISLVGAIGGIAGFIFAPTLTWLFSSVGWRSAWLCLGGIQLILAVGIGGILIKDKPEDIGQLPDGEVAVAQETRPKAIATSRVYQTPVDWKARDALGTRALWMVVSFSTVFMLSESILVTHEVTYLRDLGFSPMIAASLLSLFIMMTIPGRLIIGVLGHRFEGRHLAAACLVSFAIGMLIIINSNTLPALYLHAIMVGLGSGGLYVLMPIIAGAYYGRAYYAQIVGWITLINAVVGALGGPFAGYIYDSIGSYTIAFIIATALVGGGSVCAFLARPPKPGSD